jgi:hypothetical protein
MFQGCEGDMAAMVFSANQQSGHGFASGENRFSAMITRHSKAYGPAMQ